MIVSAALMLSACSKNRHQGGLQLSSADSTTHAAENTDEQKPVQAIVYGSFEDLDSTDYMLIPLGLRTISDDSRTIAITKSLYSSGDVNSNRSYSEKSKYNFSRLTMNSCNNIIFYNKKTEETHLLLDKPAIISDFYFPTYTEDYKTKKYYFLLFGIRDTDSNKDGFINENDAEKVYMSDMSGKNMTQITPDHTQLTDWFIDIATNNIMLVVRTDSNSDKKFDVKDEILIMKASITQPAMARDIINQDIKNSIKKILGQIS